MSLEIKGLNAGYGKLQILFDVAASFPKGSITAVVGPNGSGKSTLLKAVFGLAKVYSGEVLLDDVDITGLPPHEVASLGIAYLPQTNNVFESLTVEENLAAAGNTLAGDELRLRVQEALDLFPQLKGYAKKKARELSGGERQMLAIAMSLLRKPKVMMFDEPTASLAPSLTLQVLRTIRRLRDELGITVVLVEQNVRAALEVSERAILMLSGRKVYEGPSSDLLAKSDLGKMFVGRS